MKEEYLKEENCIDGWENYPCRHDQIIMIVCTHKGRTYRLEELDSKKYGGFCYGWHDLAVLCNRIKEWEEKIHDTCFLEGKCGSCY